MAAIKKLTATPLSGLVAVLIFTRGTGGQPMTEQNSLSPAPVPPVAPPNELPATAENIAQNSRVEKVIAAGQRVFAKFGIKVTPGRGRPRKDGQPKKSDIVENLAVEPPTGGNPALAAGPAVNSEISGLRVKAFVSGCVGILQGAVGICKKWVKGRADEAKIDKNFTDNALRECSPSPEDYKEWGDALEVCAHQYGWDFEHMPAISLGIKTVGIFAPFASLAGEFKKEIQRQREKDLATQPGQPK